VIEDRIAADRNRRHRHTQSRNYLAPDGDVLAQEQAGAAGELAVSLALGLPIDPVVSDRTHRGWNFRLADGTTVDVVTTRTGSPKWLTVPVAKAVADVYVLCRYDRQTRRVAILGWADGASVKRQATGVLVRGGPENYLYPIARLSPIDSLRRRQMPQTMGLGI
jgi:hypothetical protein